MIAFVLSNLRWIGLAFGLLAGTTLLWNGVQYIRSSAQNEIRIEQYQERETLLRQVIADQTKALDLIQKATVILDEVTVQRDLELDALEKKYTNIVSDDLGDDLNDQAPESLKELIRRMSSN